MMRTLTVAATFALGLANEQGQCLKDTGGTCWSGVCYGWRGPATCSADSKCICKEGFCAEGPMNVCTITEEKKDKQIAAQKKVDCSQDTSGKCSLFGCSSWRGETECTKDSPSDWFSYCKCLPGYCAYDGRCVAADEIDASVTMLAVAPSTELRGVTEVKTADPAPVALEAVKVVPGKWSEEQANDVQSPGIAILAAILVPLCGLVCMVKCKNGNLEKLC